MAVKDNGLGRNLFVARCSLVSLEDKQQNFDLSIEHI